MPSQYTYHWEVKDLLTMFLQAFDGSIVKRYDNSKTVGNVVMPRYVYAPKQRVLHDLVNKAQHITLPAICFSISGVRRDQSRVFNKIEGQYYVNNTTSRYDTSTASRNMQPVPVNIDVSVSILTRFQTDMDQILCNFVPYNDPYFIISWEREGMEGIEIRSEVLWSGDLAMGYPIEQNPQQPTRVSCDTSFTIKGWLFKADEDPVGRIFKIENNFYSVSATPTLQNLDSIYDPSMTETFTLSAVPSLLYSSRSLAALSLSGTFDIYGSNFNHTNNIYLSANDGTMFGAVSTINPFLSSSSLSASYPSLSGLVYPLTYYIHSDNKLTLTYPAPSATGFFDVIMVNDAGYTKLSTDAYNSSYSTQYAYVSGIQVT